MDAQSGTAREHAVARAVAPAVPAVAVDGPVHSFMMLPGGGQPGPGGAAPGRTAGRQLSGRGLNKANMLPLGSVR